MIKNLIKKILFIALLIISILVVLFIMFKYSLEGEKNLPFSINKILIVSTVDGQVNEDQENIWNIAVEEVNDIYIYIDKTIEEDVTIKEVKLDNFNIVKAPQNGKIEVLRPTGDLPNLYTYSEENHLNNEIKYVGGILDDMKSLEIANNGGILGFRVSLTDLGNFISNEKEEIKYDGTLLSDLNINNDDISFILDFDITITTSENINFNGKITLELPAGNIVEEGTSNKEITNFDDIIFKRV